MGHRWITPQEIQIARTMKRDHKMTWVQVAKIMGRSHSDLCMQCRRGNPKSYWISEDIVNQARELRAQGWTWKRIGQHFDRGDGSAICKRILGTRKARVISSPRSDLKQQLLGNL